MRNDEDMGTLGRGAVTVLAIAIVALPAAVSPASAAEPIKADVDCCTFAPGPYFQDLGEIPILENPPGADPHNVTSTATGPDGGALFRSETIGAASTTPVDGTQYLGAGTYPFFCTLHGPSMNGELIVEGGKGSVVARPSIRIKIPAQPLKKVRKSGRVIVRVKAVTDSSGIRIGVRRGKKQIGSASRIQLKAGTDRKVKVKLSRKGRKSIGKGRKVSLSVKATVDFGKSSQARRSLR